MEPIKLEGEALERLKRLHAARAAHMKESEEFCEFIHENFELDPDAEHQVDASCLESHGIAFLKKSRDASDALSEAIEAFKKRLSDSNDDDEDAPDTTAEAAE